MDWSRAFLPASYRGMPFRVEIEGADGGRRLAVGDVVAGEAPVVEDMGRVATRWSVDAYVAGSASSLQAAAFMAVLQAPGPGLLVLPMLGPVLARVESWSLSRSLTQNGYVTFTVDFHEAGVAVAPFGLVSGFSLVGGLMAAGAAVLGALAAPAIALLGGLAPAAEVLAVGLAVARLSSVAGSAAMSDADDIEAVTVALGRLTDDPGAVLTTPAGVVAEIFGAARTIARGGDPIGTADGMLAELAAAPLDGVVDLVTAAALAAGAATALTRVEFSTRRDAAAARRRLALATAEIRVAVGRLGSLSSGEDATGWLGGLLGEAAAALSREAATRAPLVRVETGVSIPSTVLAWRLYGDPERAGEIAAQARAPASLMLPVVVEVAAP